MSFIISRLLANFEVNKTKMQKKEERNRICLSALPSGWNDITTDKLEEIQSLMAMRHTEAMAVGEVIADRLYRLRVFLCLLGLKVVRRTVADDTGETVFLLRRKGIRHLFERIPMRAWQINQWIDSSLKFLDKPTGRVATPYEYVTLRRGRLKLKGPASMMADVTFQQYLVAQNTLTAYWNTLQKLEDAIKNKVPKKQLKPMLVRVSELRCRFLAAMFSPSVTETGEIREGRYVRTAKRKVYAFSMHQMDENAPYFCKVEKRMFPVMEQFYQSEQEAYSRMFPDLYTSSGKGRKITNPIVHEVEMVNSIMKEQGFTNYDAVYDSEAVRILGIMNNMCKKAKEIERMNQRMQNR